MGCPMTERLVVQIPLSHCLLWYSLVKLGTVNCSHLGTGIALHGTTHWCVNDGHLLSFCGTLKLLELVNGLYISAAYLLFTIYRTLLRICKPNYFYCANIHFH